MEARTVFARIVAGAPVPEDEERRALEHAATCEACAEEFGPVPPGGRVDTRALFDDALATALRSPEPIMRARAAERLATMDRVSATALAILVEAVERDPEERVREAARRVLDAQGPGGPVAGGPAPA